MLLPRLKAERFGRLMSCLESGGQGRNRTADASLFRAALYQLSYLAREISVYQPARDFRKSRRLTPHLELPLPQLRLRAYLFQRLAASALHVGVQAVAV